jgi:hypothetical protein
MAAAVFAVFIVLGVAGVVLYHSPGWRFSRAYRQIQLGMTRDRIQQLLGRTPDFDCRYKSYQIWYYRHPAPSPFTDEFDKVELKRGATVQSAADLPNAYNWVQCAFDVDGRLYAYTWIGETYTVECTKGSVKGSHLSKLPASDF